VLDFDKDDLGDILSNCCLGIRTARSVGLLGRGDDILLVPNMCYNEASICN
jgi:hypothetical protein